MEPPTSPNLFEAIGLEDKITHIYGDIRDAKSLNAAFEMHQPEIVLHSAAQSLVRYSYSQPVETYETNILGTVNVFEAIRNNPSVNVVVNVTSDKCYENKEIDYAYKETDPMGGHDPYSSSKGCAELVTAAYRNSFFTKESSASLASVRAGNVVGGGDWAKDRIVPDCVRALSTGKQIEVRSPKSIRPWQHVLEPLSGYLWLASLMWHDRSQYNEAWNFGPENTNNLVVGQVVEKIINNWGSGSWQVSGSDNQLHEAKLLKLDNSKAKQLLGWYPVYDAEKTFSATAKWYQAYYENPKNAFALCKQDIADYVDEAKNKQVKWSLSDSKVGV